MTNKITLDREREAFEAWYASEFLHGDEKTNPEWFSTSLCGTYRYAQVREGWTTWSARAALAEQPQADAQPVAWLVESPADLEPINGVAYTKEQADMYRAGRWTVLPVYSSPAPAKVEPVLPAGGEPEVVGYFYKGDCMGDQFNKACLKHYYRKPHAEEHEYIQPEALIRLEDHRAHVTRLQAEIRQLRQHKNDYMEAAEETRKALQAELADRKRKHLRSCQIAIGKSQLAKERHAEVLALQSELTKARELLAEREALLDRVVDHANFWHDHPYAEVVEAIARDYKALSASAGPSAPKCETCHGTGVVDDGVITDCGGVPFENGPIKCVKDCPACSAQPAPVAVVMPERMEIPSEHQPAYVYRKGWNACLDEVGRLNSETKP